MLNRNEFEVLKYLIDHSFENQRNIASCIDCSLGTINKTLKDLKEKKLLDETSNITKLGKKSLEPYKVKRAIFMAAGFGSRMVPVTLKTPKPLVSVNGKVIIGTLLDALVDKGITDITIVRGYLKNEFDRLLSKYPFIKFIDNDLYNESNNIYSTLLASKLFDNCYILEADLMLSNKNLIQKYEYSSNFLAIPCKETDDWCFSYKNDAITHLKKGGKNVYQEVGISYWTKEDGNKLKKDIKEIYKTPGGKDYFWESVPIIHKKKNYKVEIRKCNFEDIVEIDSFTELCNLDKSYLKLIKPIKDIDKSIIYNICKYFRCTQDDIKNIEFIKLGLTNISFKFSVNGINYIYRNPGYNTKKFINRKSEIYSEEVAKKLGLNDSCLVIDESGWKISKFINNSSQIDPYDKKDQALAMRLIKNLHDAKIKSPYDFDYIKNTEFFIKLFKEEESLDFAKYKKLHQNIKNISKNVDSLKYKKCLCHNDYWFKNILKDDSDRLYLIDWEYSGNYYPAADVAYFVSSLEIKNEDYLELAKLYEGHTLNKKEIVYYESVLAIVMWYWFVWALYKEANGKTIEDKEMWYQKVIEAVNALKNLK